MVLERKMILEAPRSNQVFFGQENYPNSNLGFFNGGTEFSPRKELDMNPQIYAENIQLYVESSKIKFSFDLIFYPETIQDYFHIAANKMRFHFDRRYEGVTGFSHLNLDNFDIVETHDFEDIGNGKKKSKISCILRGFLPDDMIKSSFQIGERQKKWFTFNGVKVYV